MTLSTLFDVNTQLTFYGAYHSNKVNVLIHIICVPILLWTFQVLASELPIPSFVPTVHYTINEYLRFDLNVSAIHAGLYIAYYFILEPVAAILYAPQLTLSLLTATAFSHGSGHISQAAILHGVCWIAQFLGHGLAEKRAPALLDNLIGAVVLAPFFVHLELLFGLGYRPALHKRIQNETGKEITRIRKAQGERKRAAAKFS
ncbi:putative endoplasmic reticulum membrane protein C16E8.02 [Hypsizygus marmoreus]|uniref:Endoplasmic reticulum membrane protein C16E8.02 n=1 Tax=Hypsizygus marmoreus TaxID=39966 RepID=A0A369JLT8_HYPMA|nr:putative endoplasmic reticulum membrane protein C16E8.02 [Hypsizygus marmoreus]